uniref:Tc1-like transposase n=1 Tax=Drosophila virilis TaxID=7244 RepID=Q27281_DROVI|nr:Tc1-like transposase [Drosophila virilis]CAA89219.1 Tc1-like transposase [Drosophila virilis]
MPGQRINENVIQLVYFHYHKGKCAKELAEMFSIKLRTIYNIINRAEKENRLELKHSGGRPAKLSRRDHSKILKQINENPQTSLRQLALDLKNDCNKTVSHETVRKVLKMHKYSSQIARKKPLLSAVNIQRRLNFSITNVNKPAEYWDDVIFCDETKIMLYYHDGPSKVWRKPNTALEQKNIIPTVKFGKLSVMVWGCISSKGVGELRIFNDVMTKEFYLDILKNELSRSAIKFGFVDPQNPSKQRYKLYQDNDPKHKSFLCRTWLLYNCSKVIDTPAQSPDLNPIENLWAFLKKRVGKRSPTNKNALIKAIQEEWIKIPEIYDLHNLIQSMSRRLRAVMDANGQYTKY